MLFGGKLRRTWWWTQKSIWVQCKMKLKIFFLKKKENNVMVSRAQTRWAQQVPFCSPLKGHIMGLCVNDMICVLLLKHHSRASEALSEQRYQTAWLQSLEPRTWRKERTHAWKLSSDLLSALQEWVCPPPHIRTHVHTKYRSKKWNILITNHTSLCAETSKR